MEDQEYKARTATGPLIVILRLVVFTWLIVSFGCQPWPIPDTGAHDSDADDAGEYPPASDPAAGDSLDPTVLDQLEAFGPSPPATLDANDIILPSGQTLAAFQAMQGAPSALRGKIHVLAAPQAADYKDSAIAAMLLAAYDLESPHNYAAAAPPADAGAGTSAPAQTRLAYVYGAKRTDVRTRWPACSQYLYGIDCSGMLYLLAQRAGMLLLVDGTAAFQGILCNWQVPDEWGLTVLVAAGPPQTGDVILWPSHIGLIELRTDGSKWVHSSLGSKKVEKCEKNLDANHGPIATPLQYLTKSDLGKDYKLLRLEVGGSCNRVVSSEGTIAASCSDKPPPTLKGGTINNGTYVMTSAVRYYTSCAGFESATYYPDTRQISSDAGFPGTYCVMDKNVNEPASNTRAVARGNTLAATAVCGLSGMANEPYSATPTMVKVLEQDDEFDDPNYFGVLKTFAKQ